MRSDNVIKSSLIATSAMTLYSYILSEISGENYREPDMLSKLLCRATGTKKAQAQLIAWTAHYGVGALFVVIYEYLWSHYKIKPTLKHGLLVGTLSGIVAMAVWKTVISLHPNPPRHNLSRFYFQLLPAHIVFGVVAFLVRSDLLWLLYSFFLFPAIEKRSCLFQACGDGNAFFHTVFQ